MTPTTSPQPAEALVKSPQQRRSQKTLEKILAAIAALLDEKHFERLSMAEIAERAEVSVATLYTRFEDKQTLLAYLIAQLQEVQLAASQEYFDPARWRGTLLEQRIRHLVDYLVTGCGKATGLLRTLTARQMFDERTPTEIEREKAALEILVRWLVAGTEDSGLRVPEVAAKMALSMIGSTVRSHLLIGATCDLTTEQLQEELIKAVCAYLALEGQRPPTAKSTNRA